MVTVHTDQDYLIAEAIKNTLSEYKIHTILDCSNGAMRLRYRRHKLMDDWGPYPVADLEFSHNGNIRCIDYICCVDYNSIPRESTLHLSDPDSVEQITRFMKQMRRRCRLRDVRTVAITIAVGTFVVWVVSAMLGG